MDYSKLTLGELLSSDNKVIKRNAVGILKQLQKDINPKVRDTQKMDELYLNALYRAVDKMDLDIMDWMDAEELKEYCSLGKKLDGECPACGDMDCSH